MAKRKGEAQSANLPLKRFPEWGWEHRWGACPGRSNGEARFSGKQEPGGSQKPACLGMSVGGGGQSIQLWFNLGFFSPS